MTETTARASVSRSHRSLRLGTRGSPLALVQADWIVRRLQERCGRSAVLVTVATPGDSSTAPIERLGTTGVFTSTLREALLAATSTLSCTPARICRPRRYRDCRSPRSRPGRTHATR